jgi:hypothetical protein
MKIIGQLGFGRVVNNGYSAPVFPPSFIDWAKDRFNGRENSGAVWIDVESGQPGIDDLITRLRSSSAVLPSCWWQLKYSKADLDNANLVSVTSNTYIADLARHPSPDIVSVHGNAKLKSPKSIGQIYPFPAALAANAETRDLLQGSDLIGIGFSSVPIVGRRPGHQDIHMIEPTVILPPSPMALKNPSGDPFDGDFSNGCHYRQPFPNIELSYYKNVLEPTYPFDVAGSYELIGNGPGAVFRHIVVSQKFRTLVNTSKLRGLRYTPVRLLEPDDPVVRDPFDELLKSVRSAAN